MVTDQHRCVADGLAAPRTATVLMMAVHTVSVVLRLPSEDGCVMRKKRQRAITLFRPENPLPVINFSPCTT
jgi:hypothetical protein